MDLTGKVINEKSGAPIAGAKVDISIDETSIVAVNSGSVGGFEFSNQTPCSGRPLKFTFTKDGFEPLTELLRLALVVIDLLRAKLCKLPAVGSMFKRDGVRT